MNEAGGTVPPQPAILSANQSNETRWGRVRRILEDVCENDLGQCISGCMSEPDRFESISLCAERSEKARNRNRDTRKLAP